MEHFLVILCGGTGPRLWPLSRAHHPKQFLPLISKKTLFTNTLLRALKITDAHHVLVVSNHRYRSQIKAATFGLLPPQNLLFEPHKKNTAQAILYSLAHLSPNYPQATVSFLPSDHHIPDLVKFKKDLQKAATLAQDNHSLVAIGIRPKLPNPAFGYLLPHHRSQNYFICKKFIEKPNKNQALKLIVHGALWNSGIYTATLDTYLAEFKKHSPGHFRLWSKLQSSSQRASAYRLAPDLSFDRAISEHTSNLIFFPASFHWSDVGEWQSVYSELPKANNQIAALSSTTEYLPINSSQCLVSGSPHKLIGLVGVSHLAVIDTPDALLVCNLANDHSFAVRDLVAKITHTPKFKKYFAPHEKI